LDLLWRDVLPQGISDKDKADWYHDLHWLLNQGYILLMADSTIHRAKKESKEGAAELKSSGPVEQSGKRRKRKAPHPPSEKDSPVTPKDTSEVEIKQAGDRAELDDGSVQKPGRDEQVEENVDEGGLQPGTSPSDEAELQIPDEPELPT
jgi:hypothetical protein